MSTLAFPDFMPPSVVPILHGGISRADRTALSAFRHLKPELAARCDVYYATRDALRRADVKAGTYQGYAISWLSMPEKCYGKRVQFNWRKLGSLKYVLVELVNEKC